MSELSSVDRQKLLTLAALWDQRAENIWRGWERSNKWERKDDFFRQSSELRTINATLSPPQPPIESFAKDLDAAEQIWAGAMKLPGAAHRTTPRWYHGCA